MSTQQQAQATQPPIESFNFTPTFQHKLLATLARVPESLASLRHLIQPMYFGDSTARLLCEWIFQYWDTYQIAPSATVLQQYAYNFCTVQNPQLADSLSAYTYWVDSLFNLRLEDHQFLVDEVRDWCRTSEYKLATLKAAQIINSNGDLSDIDRIFEQVNTRLAVSHGDHSLAPMLMDHNALMQALFTRPPRDTILSNWQRVNDVVGGVGRKELTCIIAPTNTGKSWALCNLGIAALQRGYCVMHVTLEMSEVLTTHRYYAIGTGQKTKDLRYAGNQIAQFNHQVTSTGGLLLVKEFPTSTLRVADLRDFITCDEHHFGRKVDVLIVDYADLMEGRTRTGGRGDDHVIRHQLSQIYTDLRAIAVTRNLACVSASQTNRASVGRERVSIADLSEAFAKAFISDVMIALCQTEEEHQTSRARFFIAKNRNDRVGSEIPLRLDYECGRMEESASTAAAGQGAEAALMAMQNVIGATMPSQDGPPPVYAPGATNAQ